MNFERDIERIFRDIEKRNVERFSREFGRDSSREIERLVGDELKEF